MTPQQFIDQLTDLIVAGRDQEALNLSEQMWPRLAPQLSSQQIDLISGLMEGAETAVSAREAFDRPPSHVDEAADEALTAPQPEHR